MSMVSTWFCHSISSTPTTTIVVRSVVWMVIVRRGEDPCVRVGRRGRRRGPHRRTRRCATSSSVLIVGRVVARRRPFRFDPRRCCIHVVIEDDGSRRSGGWWRRRVRRPRENLSRIGIVSSRDVVRWVRRSTVIRSLSTWSATRRWRCCAHVLTTPRSSSLEMIPRRRRRPSSSSEAQWREPPSIPRACDATVFAKDRTSSSSFRDTVASTTSPSVHARHKTRSNVVTLGR